LPLKRARGSHDSIRSELSPYIEYGVNDIPAAFDVFLHLFRTMLAQVVQMMFGLCALFADICEEDFNLEVFSVALILCD